LQHAPKPVVSHARTNSASGVQSLLHTLLCPLLRPSLCLVLALSAPIPGLALGESNELTQYVQTALTDKTGLPQNSVNAIDHTRDGYFWFGTQEGLARFDGLHTEVFDTIHYKGLKDNYIQDLAAARDGSLWIGSRSGLTRYKDGIFETYLSATSPINTVVEGADGTIWVGSLNGLYAVKGHAIRHFTTADGLPANVISAITVSGDGTLWVGTRKGIASYSNGAFHAAALPAAPVSAIVGSSDGSLWVATDLGLFRWKDRIVETISASSLPPHSHIDSLDVGHNGILWIGFEHSGIASLLDGKITRYTAAQGLPSDDVSAVYADGEGHLWVGLSEAGVVELRNGSFSTFGTREGLSQDMIWTVLQARDKSVWVGTNSKGLDHISQDGAVKVYTVRDGLSTDTVYALYESPDGSIWSGGEDGAVNRVDHGRITVYRDPAAKGARLTSILPNPFMGLANSSAPASGGSKPVSSKAAAAGRVSSSPVSSSPVSSNPDLIFAYHQINGLVRFHNGTFQHYPVPGLINTATIAPDGAIWVGTDHGGVSRIVNGVVTNTYTSDNGLLTNFAQAVYVDKEGVVWAGTSPGGLNRIKNGHITTYSIDQGLFDLTVGAIVEDDQGYLWMTCNKGIYKVSKKELNDYASGLIPAIHSIVYGAADGLRNVECNFAADPSAWKGDGGRLWFATTAGVASVDPARSQIRTRAPSLLIEQVFFNGYSQPLYKPIVVGPGSGDLEIHFTAPDFVAPQRIHFRYRLRGSDTDWVNVGARREAFYTKLPPGDYLFEVQDSIEDRNWSTESAQVQITLKPYFWQTELFRILCIVAALLLSAFIYRFRVRYLVERNRELEERVSQRTAELQQAIQITEAAHRALHEQATRDSLTGLWNRHSIFEMLGKEILRAKRENIPVAVLMADLDHFKQINDNYGHLTGDNVLQQVAKCIGELSRSYDFAGRYGGEEFVIVLPGCSLADGLIRAEEFRAAIAGLAIPTPEGPLQVTSSFGVAVYFDNIPAEQLIHKADEALYCAKRSGRNCVQPCIQPLATEAPAMA
jgi:diguanylate cyclase (GGDEF)-like protein